MPVPPELQPEGLCVLHFAQKVEEACSELRRETAPGVTPERREQIISAIAAFGQRLLQASMGEQRLRDDVKSRILNTFLVLMNLRENLDRAAGRRVAVSRVAGGG